MFVDSSNPALTYADTEAQERAFRSLELLVVVDVAMTETARLAHYVLPAATQFEKAEATGFTLEFPDNYCRTYNANQIFRGRAWRKVDPDGAMRMHPVDAAALGLQDGAPARCVSERGEIGVVVQVDDSVRRGVVTLPHGYGQRNDDGEPRGPVVNRLTATGHCDARSRTPFHKYVPVQIRPV